LVISKIWQDKPLGDGQELEYAKFLRGET